MKRSIFMSLSAMLMIATSCSNGGSKDKEGDGGKPNQPKQTTQSIANYPPADDVSQYPRSFVAAQDILFHLFELLNHVGMENPDIRDGGQDPMSGKQMRADFPNNPVVGGPVLKGVLDAYFATNWGRMRKDTSFIKVYFENFNLEGVLPQDTVYYIYRGQNERGGKHYSMVANNARFLFPDNTALVYSTRMELNEVEGFNTLERNDNIYQLNGFMAARTRSGKAYQATVVKPIQKNASCRWPVAGAIQVRLEEEDIAYTIDFGNGACDAKVSLKNPDGSNKELDLAQ